MPLTRQTATGKNYLEKIVSASDAQKFTGPVDMYEKQLGSAGASGNTVFTLPLGKSYIPDTNTLFVFVNGQKAEAVTTATDQTQYEETDAKTITFGAGLLNTDVVEFIVIGAGESTGGFVLDQYRGYSNHPEFSWVSPNSFAIGMARWHHTGVTEGVQMISMEPVTFVLGPGGSNSQSDAIGTSQFQYIYIRDLDITSDEIDETALFNKVNAPTYNASKGGLYYGDNRCIGGFWINGSGNLEKFYHQNAFIGYDQEIVDFPAANVQNGWTSTATLTIPTFAKKARCTFDSSQSAVEGGLPPDWFYYRTKGSISQGHKVAIIQFGSGTVALSIMSTEVFADSNQQIELDADVLPIPTAGILEVRTNGYYLPEYI